MESRREFLKKAALLSGATVLGSVPESILRALAIDPETGSTYLDAEHIVILMQENRSFDHSYGTLRGVRGYNDPRAHVLPNGNSVWLQTNGDGETFAPFRLDIKETNSTWMGDLPHAWANQVDARNDGAYDKWLIVKPSGFKDYAKKPMTLGHYTREDIPFYYSFADAFTICDQHFCSSLTGTMPNRFYLWTGTIRPSHNHEAKAHVYNAELNHDNEVSWTTFPERLEDAGISWKIYQNETAIATGLTGEENSFFANFGCNTIEYVSQYNVRFSPRHRAYLERRLKALPDEIARTEEGLKKLEATSDEGKSQTKRLSDLKNELKRVRDGLERWSEENWNKLSPREKSLHRRAFTTNEGDPHFRELETLIYRDGGVERSLKVPAGDILHQFREDVRSGNLPTVSWLVSPASFSDHPSSAWYGAWYVSEVLDILTKNPDVWKKTIFILTYDENDGLFDHVPPFAAPNPYKPESGLVSAGIDAKVEFITKEQDLEFRPRYKPRESSIGLGFRVPLVVASPWSRGGCVCSQVFDHTSVLQFLEGFLSSKTGKKIEETNISAWRRAVCGDLTSLFQPFTGDLATKPKALVRDEFMQGIHQARFKSPPTGFKAFSTEEVEALRTGVAKSPTAGFQELGTRRSCPLPYELYVDGRLNPDGSALELRLRAGKDAFHDRSAGSAFNAYGYRAPGNMQMRAYAVAPGASVSDVWKLGDFPGGRYHIRVDGPNGFMREFRGTAGEAFVNVELSYTGRGKPTGEIEIGVVNPSDRDLVVEIAGRSYGGRPVVLSVPAKGRSKARISTKASRGWYDLEVKSKGADAFSRRYAGRVETGEWSTSDPAMGGG